MLLETFNFLGLELLDILSGSFSIAFSVISIIVGIKIALRYREMKERTYILVGLTWILLVESWYPSSISFILAFFNNGVGLQNNPEIYLVIGNLLVPLCLFCWLMAFTDLMYKEKQKIILLIYGIIGIIFEIVFFYFILSGQVNQIGDVVGPADAEYFSFLRYFLIFNLIILLVTGTLFSRMLFKSDNPEHKLKGKFLLAAFFLFILGAFFDSSFELNEITLPIVRIILILSAICFYGGFILPNWMKKIFIKEK